MTANANPVMTALKTAISQGTKFRLCQHIDNPHQITLEVSGGVSKTSLVLPFNWISAFSTPEASSDKASDISGFVWESNTYTAGLLVSAVEGLPEEADPQFLVNTSLWITGGLILSGAWTIKKGRTKEGVPNHRIFMVDCGILEG